METYSMKKLLLFFLVLFFIHHLCANYEFSPSASFLFIDSTEQLEKESKK